jgi:serine/threonine-protein kinase Chk1
LGTDTPWDEPTERSPEFCRYVTGKIFHENPWNRFGESVLSAFLLLSPDKETYI